MSALTSEVPLSFFSTKMCRERRSRCWKFNNIILLRQQIWQVKYKYQLNQRHLCKLTSLGLVLFVLINKEEAGALGTEGQEDALDYGRDEDEAQQERPQLTVAHD